MEAEWRLKVITDLIFGKHNWRYGMNQTLRNDGFWPLKASTTSKVKNGHAHVITQGICNKFIEVTFYVGCIMYGFTAKSVAMLDYHKIAFLQLNE